MAKKEKFAKDVERIMKINDTLKEAGMDWEQIDRFWAKIVKEAKEKGHGKPLPTATRPYRKGTFGRAAN